jgi:hypothetical protein
MVMTQKLFVGSQTKGDEEPCILTSPALLSRRSPIKMKKKGEKNSLNPRALS